tara:strand:+ start:1244 stop:1360 length:117 start_codon:yes stop_codon:yes gene_type:complete
MNLEIIKEFIKEKWSAINKTHKIVIAAVIVIIIFLVVT